MPNLRAAIWAIGKIRNQVDHIIVNVHWGREYISRPTKIQQNLARKMIDAGASVVVGHHPHIPQGIEFYRKGVILYSLGNILFGSINQGQSDNMIAQAIFDPGDKFLKKLRIIPIAGKYAHYGHGLKQLTYDESRPLWDELILLTEELNENEKVIPGLKVNQDGVGEFLIAGD